METHRGKIRCKVCDKHFDLKTSLTLSACKCILCYTANGAQSEQ